MGMSAVTILTLIGAALAAPPAPPSQRVIGGSSTVIQEYPYMASLIRLNMAMVWAHACGGSLITPQSILTAAHCFVYINDPAMWRARLGSSFKSSGGQLIQASELIMHPDYDDYTISNDILIMKLATSAILSDSVQTILVPPPEYNIPDNQEVTVIGWGSLTHLGLAPEQLQHVDVPVVNQQLCVYRYEYLSNNVMYWPIKVTDGMLCTGIIDVGGKDACHGDSGGPVSLKTSEGHVVVGVSSWGFGCAHESMPGVKARVSYYSDWIVQHGSV